jgi:hypothetical protein
MTRGKWRFFREYSIQKSAFFDLVFSEKSLLMIVFLWASGFLQQARVKVKRHYDRASSRD